MLFLILSRELWRREGRGFEREFGGRRGGKKKWAFVIGPEGDRRWVVGPGREGRGEEERGHGIEFGERVRESGEVFMVEFEEKWRDFWGLKREGLEVL